MKKNEKALIVVAHPDDETIWMGGTILNLKNIDWTIFSLCRGDDPDRAPKFKRACQYYKAKGIISDLEDEDVMNVEQSLPQIKKRIIKEIKRKKFKYVFSHGPEGEYGHQRHIGVHLAAKGLVQKKIINCEQLFFFAYKPGPKGRIVNCPEESLDLVFNLNPQQLKTKKGIIRNLYGFKQGSFEDKSCLEKETFISL